MKPRRLHHWIAWLLPLFVLRAFVPAGHMLAPSADGLQMVLCTGAGPAAMPAMSHAAAPEYLAHLAHEHHGPAESAADHQNSHEAHALSVCVYLVASTAHAPSVPYIVPAAPAAPLAVIDHPTDPGLHSVPVLIDRIRGPPFV